MMLHHQPAASHQRQIKLIFLFVFLTSTTTVLLTNNSAVETTHAASAGPSPGYSSAPGERTCVVCHTDGPGVTGQFTIVAPETYVPGQTYQITVRHTSTDRTRLRWGFQLGALTAENIKAGTLQSTNESTSINDATISGADRQYVQHTSAGTFAGQASGANWTFNWTAPPSSVGLVTLYASGNQANNNGTSVGDQIYTANTVVRPSASAPPPNSQVQLSTPDYIVNEAAGRTQITVTRTGDTSTAATVDFVTRGEQIGVRCDDFQGNALDRCDFSTVIDTLRFAPGEASKTITIIIIDDGYAEGTETVRLELRNTSSAVTFGGQRQATLTIFDNDTQTAAVNPVDVTAFFVRQQYLDFLSREPDEGGRAAWEGVLNACANRTTDPSCDRITVSSSFFRSPEFLDFKGFFVYRFYVVAYGRRPTYAELIPDFVRITGQTNEETIARRDAFADDFASRPAFTSRYGSNVSNTEFVDTLLSNAGVQLASRAGLINDLNAGRSRASVLRAVADSPEVSQAQFNRAFVTMQYVGYLRRDPDEDGYNAWLRVLNNNPSDFRIMVNGFMNSVEYRLRFGRTQ